MRSDIALTDQIVEDLSEYYFIDRSVNGISKALGIERGYVVKWLANPRVLVKIKEKALEMRKKYSREEHLAQLEKIRELALDDEKPNLKVALASELAIGRAAGLYDNFSDLEDQSASGPAVENMSTEEIRRRLAGVVSHRPSEPLRLGDSDDDQI